MTLFIFKDTKPEEIQAACKLFGIYEGEDVVNLDDKSAIKKATSASSFKEPIVILGHSQEVTVDNIVYKDTRSTVGGKDAGKLAGLMNDLYKKKEKKDVKIYLIACEAGWNDSEKKPCFARNFASELYKKEFAGVKVQAPTSPENIDSKKHTGMRVELITKGRDQGKFGAFLWTKDLDNLRQNEQKFQQEKLKITLKDNTGKEFFAKRNKKRSQINDIQQKLNQEKTENYLGNLLDNKEAIAFLNKPEHTFIGASKAKDVKNSKWQWQANNSALANASSKILKRVQQDINDYESVSKKQKNEALKELSFLYAHLTPLKEKLEKAATTDHTKMLFKEMDGYHNAINPLKNRETSTYYKYLISLIDQLKLKNEAYPKENKVLEEYLTNVPHNFFFINKKKDGEIRVTVVENGQKNIEFAFKTPLDENKVAGSIAKKFSIAKDKIMQDQKGIRSLIQRKKHHPKQQALSENEPIIHQDDQRITALKDLCKQYETHLKEAKKIEKSPIKSEVIGEKLIIVTNLLTELNKNKASDERIKTAQDYLSAASNPKSSEDKPKTNAQVLKDPRANIFVQGLEIILNVLSFGYFSQKGSFFARSHGEALLDNIEKIAPSKKMQ